MDLKTLAAKAVEEWNLRYLRGEISLLQCLEGIQRIVDAGDV
ncbi:hypothetical protein [Pseudomonas sp. dw_358]|nr:hypothetical protein [Pseudomonas sp. dw_358]